jgi:hypothetical protein
MPVLLSKVAMQAHHFFEGVIVHALFHGPDLCVIDGLQDGKLPALLCMTAVT